MRADALAGVAGLEELRPVGADAAEIAPELLGKALDVDRDAVLREDIVARLRVWVAARLPARQSLDVISGPAMKHASRTGGIEVRIGLCGVVRLPGVSAAQFGSAE